MLFCVSLNDHDIAKSEALLLKEKKKTNNYIHIGMKTSCLLRIKDWLAMGKPVFAHSNVVQRKTQN